jgi:hypothetical protein
MDENVCPVCQSLKMRYEASVRRYSDAEAWFQTGSRSGLPDRIKSAREELNASEQERIEARREIRTHERSAHGTEVPSV